MSTTYNFFLNSQTYLKLKGQHTGVIDSVDKFTASIADTGSKFTDGFNVIIGHTRGLHRDVFYLGWPIAPSYMSQNAGGGGVAGSQLMSTAVHRSPNKLWRSNSIFKLWVTPSPRFTLIAGDTGGGNFTTRGNGASSKIATSVNGNGDNVNNTVLVDKDNHYHRACTLNWMLRKKIIQNWKLLSSSRESIYEQTICLKIVLFITSVVDPSVAAWISSQIF